MEDWQERWHEQRPRWATYSVKAHQRLDRLIADLLLYDVLVFPSPDDEAEFDRWQQQGWDPGLLAHRVTQLGDHAVVTPWDPGLRQAWESTWHGLPAQDRDDPDVPFLLTESMMADLSLAVLMGEEDDRFERAALEQPQVHPAFAAAAGWPRARQEPLELVRTFQTQRDAAALTGLDAGGSLPQGIPRYGVDTAAIRTRLRLEIPSEVTEGTLHRTLDLIEDNDFQRARRRLWSWESTLSPHCDPRDVTAGLDALVADYNAAVRKQTAATRTMWVFQIVPALVGAAVDTMFGGGLTGVVVGIGSSVVIDCVKARFPHVSAGAARASHHPGSAVQGMLAIAGHAQAPML